MSMSKTFLFCATSLGDYYSIHLQLDPALLFERKTRRPSLLLERKWAYVEPRLRGYFCLVGEWQIKTVRTTLPSKRNINSECSTKKFWQFPESGLQDPMGVFSMILITTMWNIFLLYGYKYLKFGCCAEFDFSLWFGELSAVNNPTPKEILLICQ